MITNEHIAQFIAQAHRYGDAKLMLCSSGNLSWRIGEEALISGTGSWVPTLGKEKVSICHIANGTPTNGVKPSINQFTMQVKTGEIKQMDFLMSNFMLIWTRRHPPISLLVQEHLR